MQRIVIINIRFIFLWVFGTYVVCAQVYSDFCPSQSFASYEFSFYNHLSVCAWPSALKNYISRLFPCIIFVILYISIMTNSVPYNCHLNTFISFAEVIKDQTKYDWFQDRIYYILVFRFR